MSSSDLFSSLPWRVQRTIDDAFDNPDQIDCPRPVKRRKISVEPSGGGFVVKSTSPACQNTQIPLDLIPSALQYLDVPADDEEVLSVFRNAASGWTSTSSEPQSQSNSDRLYVTRDDFRAVCAVLLENMSPQDEQERPGDDELDIGGTTDEYVDDYDKSESISSGDSEDEYVGEPNGPSSRRRKGKSRQVDELNVQAHTLTQRQKQTCLDTFALFFPHIPPSELENQKIKIKDLHFAAKLLNEKLNADQVGKLFSSSF